jgi:hypothetical protein
LRDDGGDHTHDADYLIRNLQDGKTWWYTKDQIRRLEGCDYYEVEKLKLRGSGKETFFVRERD